MSHETGRSALTIAWNSIATMAGPILAGGLLAASFPPTNCTSLAWVALVPLGTVIVRKVSRAEDYFGAYLGGLLFHLLATANLWSAYGQFISSTYQAGWLLVVHLLAFMWPALLFVARSVTCKVPLPMVVALPLVWLAAEFVRKLLWKAIDETGFPWLQLGHTQIDCPRLTQIADIGGVFAITWVIASVNGSVIDIAHWLSRTDTKPTDRRAAVVSLVVCVLGIATSWCYGTWRLRQGDDEVVGPVVAVMPADLDLTKSPDDTLRAVSSDAPFDNGAQLAQAGGAHPRADLVVWSELALRAVLREGGSPVDYGSASGREPKIPDDEAPGVSVTTLEKYARKLGASILFGCFHAKPEKRALFNSVGYVTPNTGFQGFYNKVFLVPWAEFLPRSGFPPGTAELALADRPRFQHGSDQAVFTLYRESAQQNWTFAPAICYDTCFPEFYWGIARGRSNGHMPDFLVECSWPTFDYFRREENVVEDMLLRMARFRAIECRRAVVRNARGPYSALINGNGQVLRRPSAARTPLIVSVPIDRRGSVYILFGDWLPLLACSVVAIALFYPRKTPRDLQSAARSSNPTNVVDAPKSV